MVVSGFWLAAEHFHSYSLRRFSGAICGIGLVIAAACVFNNVLDRGIDRQMARTKKRALVTGEVTPKAALIFASISGILGFAILAATTNWRTVLLILIAIVSYVVIYGWAKRKTVHGTLVGAIPGAIPPAAGYMAISNRFDSGALILFLILVFWQMAHFYSIAVYRHADYKAAGLPIMSVKYGMKITRLQIFIYIFGLAIALCFLTVLNYDGYVFMALALLLCAYWLQQGFKSPLKPDKAWGKRMFLTSLIVLMSLAILIPLGSVMA